MHYAAATMNFRINFKDDIFKDLCPGPCIHGKWCFLSFELEILYKEKVYLFSLKCSLHTALKLVGIFFFQLSLAILFQVNSNWLEIFQMNWNKIPWKECVCMDVPILCIHRKLSKLNKWKSIFYFFLNFNVESLVSN